MALALLAVPTSAGAAIVNNGDFESGSLSGWQESDIQAPGPGFWSNYTGNSSPILGLPIFPPPQGAHAAIADQNQISRQILYQDVTLPPGGSVNQLSLFGYYSSPSPELISPDTLSLNVDNEQYRIDVVKPNAPLDSVSSGDVLRNLLRTTSTSEQSVPPARLTADLSAYAGQTVRLRFAVVTTEHTLNAGADAVAINSNGFSIGEATLNKKKGTATLPVTVPDAGALSVSGKGVKTRFTAASTSVAAGTTNVVIKAKGKTKKKLSSRGKAKVKVSITYTPTGLAAATQQDKLKLKKKR